MSEPHEEMEKREGGPETIPVAVTMSILAVLVALATLLGHRASTEKILLQTEASDQWAYYQAKNIRLHEMQVAEDMFSSLTTVDKEKAAALTEKYRKEVERYEKEKDDVSDKAKEFEAEREKVEKREDRYDLGEVLLEVGLIMSSLTLLTKKNFFWITGIILGIAGVCVTVSGLLIH